MNQKQLSSEQLNNNWLRLELIIHRPNHLVEKWQATILTYIYQCKIEKHQKWRLLTLIQLALANKMTKRTRRTQLLWLGVHPWWLLFMQRIKGLPILLLGKLIRKNKRSRLNLKVMILTLVSWKLAWLAVFIRLKCKLQWCYLEKLRWMEGILHPSKSKGSWRTLKSTINFKNHLQNSRRIPNKIKNSKISFNHNQPRLRKQGFKTRHWAQLQNQALLSSKFSRNKIWMSSMEIQRENKQELTKSKHIKTL